MPRLKMCRSWSDTTTDRVVFSVEDDGKGFDPEQVLMKGPSEKGFGLTTMNERVNMMNGMSSISGARKGKAPGSPSASPSKGEELI